MCTSLPDFTTVREAMLEGGCGGLLNGVPVTCGGQYYDGYESYNCFRFDRNGSSLLTKMTRAFHYAASTVLDRDTLWMTGGYTTVSFLRDTTEFVKLDGTSVPGPRLPFETFGHCMVKVNESLVVMIGGWNNDDGSVFLFDPTSDFKMTQGPKLKTPRYLLSCGLIEIGGVKKVMVVGGESMQGIGYYYRSSEIWDLNSSSDWAYGSRNFFLEKINFHEASFLGPSLPVFVTCHSSNAMVPSPKGGGAFMVGCKDLIGDNDDIYELVIGSSNRMSWTFYKEIQYPRINIVPMLIPDDLTTCT